MKKRDNSASFGIIGLGRFGMALTECLSKAEKEVIAIDKDESRVREARRFTEMALVIESLDQETLFTIQKFFENNLNVSETSRKLFVHRNTLVYRLEKIKKITGLDLREFDHAIIFKIALMVNKYLKSNPIKY